MKRYKIECENVTTGEVRETEITVITSMASVVDMLGKYGWGITKYHPINDSETIETQTA
jgi:hypothetical protein